MRGNSRIICEHEGVVSMSPRIPVGSGDSSRWLYLDAHDYRRSRPRAMLPGCTLITIHLRRELRAAGEPEGNFREQFELALMGWRLIDRIRERGRGSAGGKKHH